MLKKRRKKYINYSDLAVEFVDEGEGVAFMDSEYVSCGEEVFEIQEIRIENEAAAERLSRRVGSYITVTCPTRIADLDGRALATLVRCIKCNLGKLISRAFGDCDNITSVLVVGLGNREVTADSLGVRCAERIVPTYKESGGVCVFLPGTYGSSGIYSSASARAIVSEIKPQVVIVVDALAAGDTDRLFTTVQLTDCGIMPGSGAGEGCCCINKETLGVPTIAIGVPTVVALSEIMSDALGMLGLSEDGVALELATVLGSGKDLLVSLAECDALVNVASLVLSEAIDRTFKTEYNACLQHRLVKDYKMIKSGRRQNE